MKVHIERVNGGFIIEQEKPYANEKKIVLTLKDLFDDLLVRFGGETSRQVEIREHQPDPFEGLFAHLSKEK